MQYAASSRTGSVHSGGGTRDDVSELSARSRGEKSEYSLQSRGTSVLSRLEQRLESNRRGFDNVSPPLFILS